VNAIKTQRVEPGALTLNELLDKAIDSLSEKSIVVITSKVVALCDNAVLPIESIDREELIRQEADMYLPTEYSVHGHHFTIKENTLIASAGIDQSNGDNHFILWPRDSWQSAREARKYLCDKFMLKNLGVLITDSTCHPLRRGTTGIALAYSGFVGLKDYIGQPDLFGRHFHVTYANIAEGLAAGAVVVMGEGAESTPIALITDIPHVVFSAESPGPDEINEWNIDIKDDLFSPFLKSLRWKTGDKYADTGNIAE
jgi:putative folate metabolism gamma-glutamate ligase